MVIFQYNYNIFLIVSWLRFKSTKLIFTRFTSPFLTISALLKHPSLLTANITIFFGFWYLIEPLSYILACGRQDFVVPLHYYG